MKLLKSIEIYIIISNIENCPQNLRKKNQRKKEILAITYEMRDLIDFSDDEEKDLINISDDKEKDLIDFSDDLIPQPHSKPKIKPKKYKRRRDQDLIPTESTGSPDGVNILKNILNYPATKNILGLSLTPDLKEKINKLD